MKNENGKWEWEMRMKNEHKVINQNNRKRFWVVKLTYNNESLNNSIKYDRRVLKIKNVNENENENENENKNEKWEQSYELTKKNFL